MIILSIDVGIKNLAHCLFEIDDNDYSKYNMFEWDVVDICNIKKQTCKAELKKRLEDGTYAICGKNASFKDNNGICYCKTHVKKMLNSDLNNDTYEEIKYDNASEIRLVDLGINMMKAYDIIFNKYKIDIVIIENQISKIATRMKTIQGMITQYFIMEHTTNIEFISSTNKLKLFTDKKTKTDYKERKKMGIEFCRNVMINNIDNYDYKDDNDECYFKGWLEHFDKHKKKDDLADCFLQGLWYINNKNNTKDKKKNDNEKKKKNNNKIENNNENENITENPNNDSMENVILI
tara:strand:+ start:687 stop:1562 length:876 start_codon:yes stop_codon:yes gene_type:complete